MWREMAKRPRGNWSRARRARRRVITGGHLEKPVDVLFDGTEAQVLAADRVKTENTHGSGCTFASSHVAAQLRQR